jgi:hypothetical protein
LSVAYGFRDGRPGFPPPEILAAMLLWGMAGVVTGVHTVRMLFRTVGVWKKLLVLAIVVGAIPVHLVMFAAGQRTIAV